MIRKTNDDEFVHLVNSVPLEVHSSRGASGTICLRKRRRPLPKPS
jgi:hypothetical protein